MRLLFILILAVCAAFSQTPGATAAPQAAPRTYSDEDIELSQAVGDAGNSPIDLIRALEKHLEKYPNSSHRKDIERTVLRGAIETKDDRRIIEYGERVLAREPDDLQVLDRMIRALLETDDQVAAARALPYARHYEQILIETRKQDPPGHYSAAQWQEEVDRGLGRAIVSEARATGNMGHFADAIELARRAYDTYPSAESAREMGRWLVRAGKPQEAIIHYADAFAIPDARTTDTDRAKDRGDLGDIYRKIYGSEKGLGDIILEAYDRTSGLIGVRRLRLHQVDPNSKASNLADFTISGVDGHKLSISSLKGKAVVFDFWATWCGPCRAQHPLYEQVMRRFHDSSDVVFLFINTDDERSAVEPFLKESHWDPHQIYYEDGLSRVLSIANIPTTIVMDRHGEIISRMNGYVPGRFVDLLSDRIRDALKD